MILPSHDPRDACTKGVCSTGQPPKIRNCETIPDPSKTSDKHIRKHIQMRSKCRIGHRLNRKYDKMTTCGARGKAVSTRTSNKAKGTCAMQGQLGLKREWLTFLLLLQLPHHLRQGGRGERIRGEYSLSSVCTATAGTTGIRRGHTMEGG